MRGFQLPLTSADLAVRESVRAAVFSLAGCSLEAVDGGGVEDYLDLIELRRRM